MRSSAVQLTALECARRVMGGAAKEDGSPQAIRVEGRILTTLKAKRCTRARMTARVDGTEQLGLAGTSLLTGDVLTVHT